MLVSVSMFTAFQTGEIRQVAAERRHQFCLANACEANKALGFPRMEGHSVFLFMIMVIPGL